MLALAVGTLILPASRSTTSRVMIMARDAVAEGKSLERSRDRRTRTDCAIITSVRSGRVSSKHYVGNTRHTVGTLCEFDEGFEAVTGDGRDSLGAGPHRANRFGGERVVDVLDVNLRCMLSEGVQVEIEMGRTRNSFKSARTFVSEARATRIRSLTRLFSIGSENRT